LKIKNKTNIFKEREEKRKEVKRGKRKNIRG